MIVLFLVVLFIWSCNEDEGVEVIEEPIIADTSPYHSIKLTLVSNTIPYTYDTQIEMYDEDYGAYTLSVYDSQGTMVWELIWRDLFFENNKIDIKPVIANEKIIVSVLGVISVHDLVTGEFLWEVETGSSQAAFDVSQERLYVVNYEDTLVSGFDLNTGEHTFEWTEDYTDIVGIEVREDKFVLFYESSDGFERNGYLFDQDWTYERRVQVEDPTLQAAIWDQAESSDGSEDVNLLIDGRLETAWSENVKGYGEKEWVELRRNLPTLVHELVLYNGDHTSEKAYEENSKIKNATISIGNNKSFNHTFNTFEYNKASVIKFIRPITADFIFIQIEGAEPGTLYKNTSLTEVYTR